jgi:hypothetical protein
MNEMIATDRPTCAEPAKCRRHHCLGTPRSETDPSAIFRHPFIFHSNADRSPDLRRLQRDRRAARDARFQVAPVGEKDGYVDRAIAIVRPFVGAAFRGAAS